MKDVPTDKIIEWLLSGDTGTSSKTIIHVVVQVPMDGPDIPYDLDDFRRCYRLIEKIPELRDFLPNVAIKYPRWIPLVDNWDKLTEMYGAIQTGGVSEESREMWRFMQGLIWDREPIDGGETHG